MTPTSAPASEGVAPGEASPGDAETPPETRSFPLRLQDYELVQRIRRGDVLAFEDLVNRHSDDLFGLAYSLVGNRADAEDVLQQTLLGAFRRIESFEGRSTLKTWLVRILVNQASKARRSRRIRRSVPLDAGDGRAEDGVVVTTPSGTAAVDGRVDLLTMLQELSSDHREILLLRETQGMSYDEIAESLQLPRGTVESRLFRARQELRRKFEGYFT